jgi:hypothetical protein
VWQDTSRVFTREDGTALRPGPSPSTSPRWWRDAPASGQVPRPAARRGHDAASFADHPPIVISETLVHSTVAFTMDVYTELAEAAALAIAAFIPGVPRVCQRRPEMAADMKTGTPPAGHSA